MSKSQHPPPPVGFPQVQEQQGGTGVQTVANRVELSRVGPHLSGHLPCSWGHSPRSHGTAGCQQEPSSSCLCLSGDEGTAAF